MHVLFVMYMRQAKDVRFACSFLFPLLCFALCFFFWLEIHCMHGWSGIFVAFLDIESLGSGLRILSFGTFGLESDCMHACMSRKRLVVFLGCVFFFTILCKCGMRVCVVCKYSHTYSTVLAS